MAQQMGAGCDWSSATTEKVRLIDLEESYSDYMTLIFQFVSDGTDRYTGLTGQEEVDWEKPLKVYYMPITKALDEITGPGWEIDPDDRGEPHINHLQKAMRIGALLPPAVVDHAGHLIDGRHRIHAAHRLGYQQVPYICATDAAITI